MSAHSNPKETFLKGWEIEIAARVWGADGLPPLLALHGWLDNAGSFDRLAPLLTSFQVFAVDLPGHGLTAHRPGFYPNAFISWVPEVAALCAHQKWQKPFLMGHSMGAGVASLFAGTFPEKVAGLILLDGLAPLTAPSEEGPLRTRQTSEALLQPQIRKPRVLLSLEDAYLVKQKKGHVNAEAAKHLVDRGIQKSEEGYLWRSDLRLGLPSLQRMTEVQVEAYLKAIACPTLLVEASDGFLQQAPHFLGMAKKISLLTHEQVEGRHHVHLEMPERVAPLILNWAKAL